MQIISQSRKVSQGFINYRLIRSSFYSDSLKVNPHGDPAMLNIDTDLWFVNVDYITHTHTHNK